MEKKSKPSSHEPNQAKVSKQRYFATCARGVEPLLAGELSRLGIEGLELGLGGVHFSGGLDAMYKANLGARTAIRVLMPLLETRIETQDDLYDAIHQFPWEDHMTADHTLAVDCNLRDSVFTHSQYALLRVKDAICDRFRERTGRRPSIDRERPMIGLNLHLSQNRLVLSLDTSWESLHKRGYRPIQPRAPLNEALASALLLRVGYQGQHPLVDPMCGAGTLPIEATWIAINRLPGLTRKWFAFQGWVHHDIGLFAQVRNDLRALTLARPPQIIQGSDERQDALELASQAAHLAGVGHLIQWVKQSFAESHPPEGPPGWVFCNPPYGVRIGTARVLKETYRRLGDAMTQKWKGWSLGLFTATPELARETGLDFPHRWVFPNGALKCHLYAWGPLATDRAETLFHPQGSSGKGDNPPQERPNRPRPGRRGD